jgi:excisionase family DNA binding protein
VNTPIAYSIADAARSLGVGRTKLYELVGQGEIAVVKIGSRTLVPHNELVAFLDRRRFAA